MHRHMTTARAAFERPVVLLSDLGKDEMKANNKRFPIPSEPKENIHRQKSEPKGTILLRTKSIQLSTDYVEI